jgi:hypothetical protein
VKTLHFVPILVLATAATFACDDSEDRVTGSAGTKGISGAAGKSGTAGNAAGTTTAGSAGNDSGGGGAASTPEGGSGGQDDNSAGMGGAALGGAGGAGGAADVAQAPLEIIGAWNDNFAGTQIISATDWNGSAILAYDNATNVVYTQYPADNMYSPNKFAKTVYTDIVDSSFYFCALVFSADTLAAAQADTGVADATDPDHSGCSGFSWTKATRQ